MNSAIKPHECTCCGEEIQVDYNSKKDRVKCPNCNAVFGVDHDAEFVDGAWRDLTKLWRV